jgi:hypothetical protein
MSEGAASDVDLFMQKKSTKLITDIIIPSQRFGPDHAH